MKRKFELPRGHKRARIKFFVLKLLPFVVLTIIDFLILCFFGERMFQALNEPARLAFYIMFALIPFIATGFPFCMIDRTYVGITEKVELKSVVAHRTIMPVREGMYMKHTIYLNVRLENGKIIRRKAFVSRPDAEGVIPDFRQGDRVFHLYGSKYVVKFPEKTDQLVICAVCGSSSEKHIEYCRNCGSLLVDREEELYKK